MDGKRAALALALTFVVACGGGAGAAPGGAGSTAPAAADPSTATSAAPATAVATAAGPLLLDILSAARATQYKITYKLTTTGTGAESFSGDQTWYFKPPRSRFDFASDFGGQRTTMSVFSLPDGSFMCFAVGGQTTCLSAPSTGSPLDQNQAAVTQRALVDHPDQYGATFTGARTIAGQPGLCYTVNAVAAAATGFSSGSFCYTKEGIALLSQFTVQGATWSMEATNVSTTVPDSDFTLPATPTVIGRP